MQPARTLARRLWEAVEPLHAVVYFAPEPVQEAKSLGLRGFWMGYFAGRVAPLGPVPPEAVTAMVYGFAPAMVARALPDAWTFAEPARITEVRVRSAAAALRTHLESPGIHALEELADPLWEASRACRYEGRPLAAGWSRLPRPDDLVAAAWLAATVLREHRGDGHVLAAVGAGLSGLDATLTLVATGAITREVIQPNRGWSDDEWDQATRRLQARGLLDGEGRLTDMGTALRHEVEEQTDRLAASPVERLGVAGIERVIDLAAPLSRQLIDTGVVPVPNPIGAPRP